MDRFPLIRPSPEEVAFFSGSRGKDISSLASSFESGAIQANHLEATKGFAKGVSKASDVILGYRESEFISEEGGIITPDSSVSYESVNMTRDPHSRKNRRLFNLFKTWAGTNGFAMLSRPLPISWGLDHISERFKERSPEDFDYADPFFIKVLGMSLSMLRVFEETVDWDYTRSVPFILPAKRGIYLGWAEREKYKGGENRITIVASEDKQRLGLREYDWFPSVKMLVNTYYSADQMSLGQKQIRYNLLKLLDGALGSAFITELDSYSYVKNDDRFGYPVIWDSYDKAFLKLANIMESPVWNQNVRLPQRMRESRGYTR